MYKKLILTLVISVVLAGCSTVKTVQTDEYGIKVSWQGYKSKCKSIPRVYSGVAYNFCLLYGEANSSPNSYDIQGAEILLWDSAFSLVADTLILPYTISTQIESGNIPVR